MFDVRIRGSAGKVENHVKSPASKGWLEEDWEEGISASGTLESYESVRNSQKRGSIGLSFNRSFRTPQVSDRLAGRDTVAATCHAVIVHL